MFKALVFGDLPIASEVCQMIIDNKQCQLVGVVIGNEDPKNNDPFINTPILQEYAETNGIPIFELSELPALFEKDSLDFGVCARFSKILKKQHIDIFNFGVINFHGGLLPEYAGLYSVNHALLNNEVKSGGTIHWIDEGIDTGEIIKRCEFDISSIDTASSVFKKTQTALLEGLKSIFNDLLESDFKFKEDSVNNKSKAGYYNKKSLENKKEVDLNKLIAGDRSELNRIRAFDFPGYEPAYIIINDVKVYLRFTS